MTQGVAYGYEVSSYVTCSSLQYSCRAPVRAISFKYHIHTHNDSLIPALFVGLSPLGRRDNQSSTAPALVEWVRARAAATASTRHKPRNAVAARPTGLPRSRIGRRVGRRAVPARPTRARVSAVVLVDPVDRAPPAQSIARGSVGEHRRSRQSPSYAFSDVALVRSNVKWAYQEK